MTLHPLVGHEAAAGAVARAFAAGRLPQALLIHGPPGVGKQRLGLWIGQLVLCESPGAQGPCQQCRHCSLARKLEHPDLHWYFPLKRPPSRGSRERNDEVLEELRLARLAELRKDPLYPTHSGEGKGLHLGVVRNLRKKAVLRPAMALRSLFLVGNAEELAVQDVQAEAANALLKLLEEPPEGVRFVLTSSEPGRVLPTIRSRTTSLFLPGLPEEEVARFLQEDRGADPEEARKAAALSGGAIGRALGFLPGDNAQGDEDEEALGTLERERRQAFHLLQAALKDSPSDRFLRALDFKVMGGREHHEVLSFLEAWLRDLGRVATSPGVPTRTLNPGAFEWLEKTVQERDIHPTAPARALALVQEAREQAAGNVNPQLLVFGLLTRLHRELRSGASPAPTPS